MPRGVKKVKEEVKQEEIKPEVKVEIKKETPKNLREAFEFYNLQYREGVHRLVDLAKIMGVPFQENFSLEDVLNLIKQKNG